MDKLAEFLIEKETITGKEFMKIFRELKGLPDPEEEKKAEKSSEEDKEPVEKREAAEPVEVANDAEEDKDTVEESEPEMESEEEATKVEPAVIDITVDDAMQAPSEPKKETGRFSGGTLD